MTETPTTQDQPRGNFVANMVNAGKSRNGKDKPNVRGRISAPGNNREFDISLWTHEYAGADGATMLGMNGNVENVSRSDEAMDQFRSHARGEKGPTVKIDRIPGKDPIELESGKVVIFQSKNKEGDRAPNGNVRTNFYGYWNDNGKIVEVGIWAHKDKNTNRAFLGGATQYPMPGKDAHDFGTMSQADLEKMQREADSRNMEQPDRDNETPKKPEKPVRRSSRFMEDDARSR
jgi:hypothetical protein